MYICCFLFIDFLCVNDPNCFLILFHFRAKYLKIRFENKIILK